MSENRRQFIDGNYYKTAVDDEEPKYNVHTIHIGTYYIMYQRYIIHVYTYYNYRDT